MDYSRFTVQDFLMDDYFQNWVLKPDHENETFWRHWLIEHPQQKADILQARELMRSLDIKPAILPPAKVNKIWNNIEAQTREAPVIQLVPEKERAAKTQINWFQVAAVFIGILFTGLAFWKFMQPDGQNIMVATGFGETREITLPDNSRVVLNGNSSLSYGRQWNASTTRQVKLQGEAYFSVTHTQNHQPFRVQASDRVAVEVLGTKFVVTNRPHKTRIVLNEGKVKVAVAETALKQDSAQAAETVLKPGEMAEVSKGGQLHKSAVENLALYSAFLQNNLVFVDTPLSEVARVLEDTYGYKVSFTEPSLASRRFTGSSPAKKINLLLVAIEKSFRLTVVKKGRHITIKPA